MASHDGKKSGGRQKGTLNKDRDELMLKAQELNCDPFEILLLFAKGDWAALGYDGEKYLASEGKFSTMKFHIEPSVRAKSASEACQYLFAKRKTVEVEAPNGLDVNIRTQIDPKIIDELVEAQSCETELPKS